MTDMGMLRWSLQLDRGGRWCGCDLCGKRDYRMECHHIITKGRTMNNSAAREASEVKELFAYLCQSCHSKAHNPEMATHLLGLNIRRYGRSVVKAAFKAAIGHQAGNGGITFPRMIVRRITQYGSSKSWKKESIRSIIYGCY